METTTEMVPYSGASPQRVTVRRRSITISLDCSPVEIDAMRRLFNRLVDQNGKPHDTVRRRLLEKLQKAAAHAEQQAAVRAIAGRAVQMPAERPCVMENA